MLPDELHRLREHATRSAARIVDAHAGGGLEDFHENPHDGLRRVVFAALLPFVFGEVLDAVFVGAAEDVAVRLDVAERQLVREEVDHVAEHPFVDVAGTVELRQHALQRLVLALDGDHRVVDRLAVVRLVRDGGDLFPARGLRNEEDVLLHVGVAVLLVAVALRLQLAVAVLEGVRDIPQKQEPHQHLAVLRGGQLAAHQIRRVPELGLKPKRRRRFFLLHICPFSFPVSAFPCCSIQNVFCASISARSSSSEGRRSLYHILALGKLCKCSCRHAGGKTHLRTRHPPVNVQLPKPIVAACHVASCFQCGIWCSLYHFPSVISNSRSPARFWGVGISGAARQASYLTIE